VKLNILCTEKYVQIFCCKGYTKYKIQARYVVSIILPIVLHAVLPGIRYWHDTIVCPSTCL